MQELTCEADDCANTFTPPSRGGSPQRFCSVRCQKRQAARRNVYVEQARCKNCQMPFMRERRKTGQKVYCSTACQYEYRAQDYRDRYARGDGWFGPAHEARNADAMLGRYYAALRSDPCSICGGPGGEIDHIEPRSQGGPNHWENYTGICKSCNASKNDKPLIGFLGWRQAMRDYDSWRCLVGDTGRDRGYRSGGRIG